MAKKEIFKFKIDAKSENNGPIENKVEVEMNCSPEMAISTMVDFLIKDRSLRHIMYAACTIMQEKENDYDDDTIMNTEDQKEITVNADGRTFRKDNSNKPGK